VRNFYGIELEAHSSNWAGRVETGGISTEIVIHKLCPNRGNDGHNTAQCNIWCCDRLGCGLKADYRKAGIFQSRCGYHGKHHHRRRCFELAPMPRSQKTFHLAPVVPPPRSIRNRLYCEYRNDLKLAIVTSNPNHTPAFRRTAKK